MLAGDLFLVFGVELGDEEVRKWPSDYRNALAGLKRRPLTPEVAVSVTIYDSAMLKKHSLVALGGVVHGYCPMDSETGTQVHHDCFPVMTIDSITHQPMLGVAGIGDRPGTPCEVGHLGFASCLA